MAKIYTHVTRHGKLDLNVVRPVQNKGVKPIGGLWASIDNSWENWCRFEMPEWLDGQRYRIPLKDSARVLEVRSINDLKGLPKVIPDMYKGMPKEILDFVLQNEINLDFEAIAREYDAIEVYANRGTGLYDAMYSWDCDSVVIFNLEAIAKIEEIAPYVV